MGADLFLKSKILIPCIKKKVVIAPGKHISGNVP
jgi:hypothetical protein